MRFLLVAVLLFLGAAGAAHAAYPHNTIEWRPKDETLASTPMWGYDANGDIACPTQDGVDCITSRQLVDARSAERTLSCGEQMRRLTGASGYDTAGHWCRELALRHGNRDGFTWQPPAHGVIFYWRRNPATGNIECVSDGTNCLWWTPNSLEAAFKSTNVVSCPEADYAKPGHWCNQLAQERRNNGHEWKLHQTLHFGRTPATAINDSYYSYSATGDIQCPSNDGITCLWTRTRAEAEATTQPVVCGAEHQARFGYNGYDTTGHWCRRFALAEGNAKGLTYQWGLSGLVAGAGAPDVMCASDNAANCHWGAPLSVSFKAANPLVCGQDHKNRYGDLGYESAAHWCGQFATTERRGNIIWIGNTSGLPAQVCRPVAFQGEDRDMPYAEIRCTELAAGVVGAATSTVVTALPFPENDDEGYLYQSVCVQRGGAARLFVGPVVGVDAQVSIGPDRIEGDATLLDQSGEGTTCRQSYSNFTYR